MAAKVISDGAGKVNESSALLAAFMEKYLKISDPIPAAPTGPAIHRASDHLTGDAIVIFDAICRDKCLGIAEQVSRGTLLSTRCGAGLPDSTDSNLTVSRGEMLVLLPMVKSESNKSRHVVCNRHGDVGELLGNLRLTPIQDSHYKFMILASPNAF